jgi:spore coat polysaccharide biosynthesis protein SpsF (cytidylyltransferase family)
VIQARCGSTRFPGKVLAVLGDRPMLAHVVERASRAATIDGVVVATTKEADDDAVASLAARCGAGVTRGPAEDVLTRFVMAAREHAADVIVRITADCPLLDPAVVDAVVLARDQHDADYASNLEPPTYPDGYDVEVLTTACLMRVDSEATLPYEREHVTARIREHESDYHVVRVAGDHDLSWMRLTVDVPEDLLRAGAVLAALPSSPPPDLAAVTALFESDPALGDQRGLPRRDERYRAQRDAAQGQETTR